MIRNRLSRFRFRPMVHLLEHRNLPSFVAPAAYVAGTLPVNISASDFNHDGLNDVVVANQTAPGLASILLNQGGGVFGTPKGFPTGGSNPSSVSVGDFNGNGELDLAVANQSSGTVGILRGTGSGVFRRPVTYAAGTSPTAIEYSEFTGDGALDILVVNAGTNTISVLLNNGDGTYQAPVSYDLGTKAKAITTGDFNSDGNYDFVAVGHDSGCEPQWCFPTNPKLKLFLGQGDGTFVSGQSFSFYSSLGDVAAGDLNSDGKTDLVSVDVWPDHPFTAQLVWVQLGNGDGTFQPPIVKNIGASSAQVNIEYVDTDSILDLVVIRNNTAPEKIGILKGNGNGTFANPTWDAGGVKPGGVAALDLTGDGKVDLSVVNSVAGTGTITLLEGNGSGGFTGQPPKYGGIANYIAAADYTADGKIDFAATNGTTITIHGSAVDGTFQSITSFSAGPLPSHLHADDFDADSVPDLAISTLPETAGNVSVVLGTGNSDAVQLPKSYDALEEAREIAVADFNGDGIPDLAVAGGDSPTDDLLVVMLGTGGGTFGNSVTINTGAATVSIKVGDLNSDGIPDLVTGSKVLFGVGNGTFLAPINHGGKGCAVVIADFNNDGSQDLVTGDCDPPAPTTTYLWSVLGNGNGTFKAPVKFTSPYTDEIAAADYDEDGNLDIAIEGQTSGYVVHVLMGNGNGLFQAPVSIPIVNGATDLDVADLNEDGNADLIISQIGYSFVSVLFGNGNGTFQPKVQIVTASSSGRSAVADLNGDGNLDIATVRIYEFANDPTNDVDVLLGNGDGTFQPAMTYLDIPQPADVAAADLDGDGDLELLVSDKYFTSGVVHVFLNTSNGLFAAARANDAVPDPGALASGDFNGDGFRDLALARTSAASFSVMISAGNGFFLPATTISTGSNPQALTVADFNGDGELDIVSANSGGTISVLFGNGNGTFQAAINFPAGSAPAALAVADFDADGDLDLVVANSIGAGTVSLLFNNGNGTFQAPLDIAVGATPLSVVTGDFDNDGKADIAVANSVSGTVSVILGNGDGEFKPLLHYTIGDGVGRLATGDADGDGFTDLLVTSANGVVVLRNAADWPAPLPSGGGRDGNSVSPLGTSIVRNPPSKRVELAPEMITSVPGQSNNAPVTETAKPTHATPSSWRAWLIHAKRPELIPSLKETESN